MLNDGINEGAREALDRLKTTIFEGSQRINECLRIVECIGILMVMDITGCGKERAAAEYLYYAGKQAERDEEYDMAKVIKKAVKRIQQTDKLLQEHENIAHGISKLDVAPPGLKNESVKTGDCSCG